MTDHIQGPGSGRITRRPTQSSQGTANSAAGKTLPNPAESRQTDSVNISKEAEKMENLFNRIKQSPDINSEKVEALKQAIAEGSYQPDAEQLADKLVDLENKLIR